MTALEALEAFSSDHPETVAELLEWPYRRFRKAFDAWQRRRMVAEWNDRKLAHIAAVHSNPYGKTEEKQEALQSIEEAYEGFKRDVMKTPEERQSEYDESMGTDFMRAGKRNQTAVLSHVPEDVIPQEFVMPGEESFGRLR